MKILNLINQRHIKTANYIEYQYNMSSENTKSEFTVPQKAKDNIKKILEAPKESYKEQPKFIQTCKQSDLEIAHKVRQNQMKEGDVAQVILGSAPNYENLGKGHETGLDCKTKDNSVFMEVKNQWNTANSAGKEVLCDKLVVQKEKYPNAELVWGIINPKNGKGKRSIIKYKNYDILKLEGVELIRFVYKDYEPSDVMKKYHDYVQSVLARE